MTVEQAQAFFANAWMDLVTEVSQGRTCGKQAELLRAHLRAAMEVLDAHGVAPRIPLVTVEAEIDQPSPVCEEETAAKAEAEAHGALVRNYPLIDIR